MQNNPADGIESTATAPTKRQKAALGFAARLFDQEKTAAQEIDFAGRQGFGCVQFRGSEEGITAAYLGEDLPRTADRLRQARVAPTVELLIGLGADGRTPTGKTPLDVLEANLPAFKILGVRHVHWHLYPLAHADMPPEAARPLEEATVPQARQALALAQEQGFSFGIENNSPEGLMFVDPERCAWLLEEVPGLGLVWDLNHTRPEDTAAFASLAHRMVLLHVSDTRLPRTNDHLPLGMGSIDLAARCRPLLECCFDGPAILEIGGLPHSGGFGRDTDEALTASRQLLETLLKA